MKNKFGSFIGTLSAILVLGMMAQPRAFAQDGHIPLVTRTLGGVTTTNLDDNFESPAPLSAPDNGALPGSWGITADSGSTVQIWDASLSPNLVAFQGNQYARIARPGGGSALLGGTFSSGVSTGTLKIQFALRVLSYTPDYQAGVELDNGTYNNPDIRFSLTTRSDGSIQHYDPNTTSYQPTGITGISTNDWQRWLINVDLDNNRYNLTVDNQTAYNLPFFALGGSSRLLFSSGGGQFFVDAIPEPTMAALMGVGGLLLLRRRR